MWARLVFLVLFSVPCQAAIPVWIDADPSIGLFLHDADDGFAMVAALQSPELEVRGISIVKGNTSVKKGTRIAEDLMKRFPEQAVRIFPGGDSPAVAALDAELRKQPLTILALGPMTNLAALLQRYPRDAGRIRRIICVAGSPPGAQFSVPGWMPYDFHDTNFIKDPEAMRTVLSFSIPIDFIPFDVSKKITIDRQEFDSLASGGASNWWLYHKAKGWFSAWEFYGADATPLFDALAIVAAVQPELVHYRPAKIEWHRKRLSTIPTSKYSGRRVAMGFDPDAKTAFWKRVRK